MKKYCILLFVFAFLVSCTNNSRKNYNIPDTKVIDFEKQQEASISILSDAIKNNPSNPDNYYKRALVHIKTDNYADALVDINRAESLNPNSGEYLYVKALAQNYLNDPKKALSNALAAETQNYDMPELYTLLADIYTKLGNFNKANGYIQKAEGIYPFFSDVFLVKGKYFAKRGDTITSLANLKRAIKYKPNGYEAYDNIIKIYNKTNAIDSALVFNEMALTRFPLKKEMVYNKAQILENLGAADSAVKVYKRFMSLSPERLDIYGKIGTIYMHHKNYAAAIIAFNKWAEEAPENIIPLKKAASMYESVKNYPAAKKYIEKALRIEPDNTNLGAVLAAYNYQIEAAQRVYVDPQQYYRPEKRERAAEQTVEEKSIFGNTIGPIETIQKRRPVSIGKDTTSR